MPEKSLAAFDACSWPAKSAKKPRQMAWNPTVPRPDSLRQPRLLKLRVGDAEEALFFGSEFSVESVVQSAVGRRLIGGFGLGREQGCIRFSFNLYSAGRNKVITSTYHTPLFSKKRTDISPLIAIRSTIIIFYSLFSWNPNSIKHQVVIIYQAQPKMNLRLALCLVFALAFVATARGDCGDNVEDLVNELTAFQARLASCSTEGAICDANSDCREAIRDYFDFVEECTEQIAGSNVDFATLLNFYENLIETSCDLSPGDLADQLFAVCSNHDDLVSASSKCVFTLVFFSRCLSLYFWHSPPSFLFFTVS